MLRLPIATALVLAAVSPSFAALPPQYQRMEELGMIVNSMEIVDRLGIVDSIQYVDYDLYRVTGGKCSLDVRIVDVPLKPGDEMIVGPGNFSIEVGEPVCN